ncbi:MAG: response regulator [Oligoflexia bacterium]|nr:response regulator [Oligoflexia bacterium]
MPSKKLLVADDSLTIQKVIRLALSNEGYEIQAVSEGNDAIHQILLFRPDVVLVDVSLPGKTAFELKREANEHPDLQDVRFVLMSSAFEKVDETQASEVQFQGRLTKPFDPAHLREVLSKVFTEIAEQAGSETRRIQRPAAAPPAPPPQAFPELDGKDHVLAEPEFTPPDSDIRQLTESTIRMSGLDDFEWSVQEPSLKPPASMLEPDDTSFPAGASGALAYHNAPEEIPEPSFTPPPPPQASPPPIPGAPRKAAAPATAPAVAGSTLSTRELEELVLKEVRKVLPQLAEKLLKEEIHRMLSERP